MKASGGILFAIGGFAIGFIIGLGLGLLYAWELNPPLPGNTRPALLEPRAKEVYTVLVGAAYLNNGNIELASHRLAQLEDRHIDVTLALLTERYVLENRDPHDIQALATLASALGQTTTTVRIYAATPTPTATSPPPLPPTPPASPTPPGQEAMPSPTPSPTPVPGPSFRLAQSVVVCDPRESGILRVFVRHTQGSGLPGMELRVTWPGGEDRFFTGLKIPAEPGYADFEMKDGEAYRLEIVGAQVDTVAEIQAERHDLCSDLPPGISPSWQVVWQQHTEQ